MYNFTWESTWGTEENEAILKLSCDGKEIAMVNHILKDDATESELVRLHDYETNKIIELDQDQAKVKSIEAFYQMLYKLKDDE